jgi:hypothetical protein
MARLDFARQARTAVPGAGCTLINHRGHRGQRIGAASLGCISLAWRGFLDYSSHVAGYTQMKKMHVPVYLLVIVSLSVSSAFAQAAAESALINSMSSTSAAKAGTALGRALNQAATNVQQRTLMVPQGAGVRNAPKNQVSQPLITASGRRQSVPGGLGISVRGGQLKCDPISPAVQTSDPKSAQPVQGNCGSRPASVGTASPTTQDKNATNSAATSPAPK